MPSDLASRCRRRVRWTVSPNATAVALPGDRGVPTVAEAAVAEARTSLAVPADLLAPASPRASLA